MKAIHTKYLGPSATRCARIRVKTEGLPAKYHPLDYAGDPAVQARELAIARALELGWISSPDDLVSGTLPDGTHAHCIRPVVVIS